jgi:hypothetical protein
MWKFVSSDKANRDLSAETNFHIQKYDGLENTSIENPSRGMQVTLGSSTDPNLGHNPIKI